MEEHPHFPFETVSPELVPPLQLPKMVEDDSHDYCPVDFITQMHCCSAGGYCEEVPREKEDGLRVFWYRTATTNGINPARNLRSSSNEYSVMNTPQPESFQERIKSFLLSLYSISGDGVLVQFWAPIRSSTGQRMLSVAEQPFGLDKLYSGLCSYRYHCINNDYPVVEIGDNTSEPVGPIGRAFARGFCEYIPVDCYSIEEFPLRDIALHSCGIKEYLAMPIFKEDDYYQQHCIGVFEFLSLHTLTGDEDSLACQLGEPLQSPTAYNFAIGAGKLHSTRCWERNPPDEDVICKVIEEVQKVPKIRLIQLWLPCKCYIPESISKNQPNTTKLLCDFRISNNSLELRDFECFESYCVRDGKSCVERAYSQVKTCFSKHTHQFSILDYPLVPLTRSCGLTACFAIPLTLINPYLPPAILEVFLPPQLQYSSGNDENLILLLKNLLARLDYEFSKYDCFSHWKLAAEAKFHVYFSHLEGDFVFFDVYRDSKSLNMHKFFGKELRKENAQDKAENSRPQIDSTNMKYQIPYEEFIQQLGKKRKDAAAALNVSVSTFKRFCKQHGIPRWGKRVDANQIIPWTPSEPVVERRVESVPQSEMLLVSNNDTTEEKPGIELLSNSNATERERLQWEEKIAMTLTS